MSWLFLFSWVTDGLFMNVQQWLTGSFDGQARELFAVLIVLLPALPVLSTLLLLISGHRTPVRVFHLVAWGLGSLFPLFILLFGWNRQNLGLWGAWLYVLLAIGSFLVEIRLLRVERRPATRAA
jgi:hypothetical protein